MTMRDLLVAMAEQNASDLHISAGVAPTLRVHGHLVQLDYPPLDLEQTKALWFQAISEARPDPTKEQVMRAYAAQFTVMENANALAAKAIRTCGGQAMLKSLSLERIYRDSRCGALMLPWTAEICLDRLGRETLYEPGEKDE